MSGIIFGLGLTISSMTNPEKIKSFLDIFGIWDPSLIFVMGGGILVTAPLFHFLKNKDHLILFSKFDLPIKNKVDMPLIMGAILFGIGWGAVGFCPGPAISSIAFLNPFALTFVTSMIVGFYFIEIIKK